MTKKEFMERAFIQMAAAMYDHEIDKSPKWWQDYFAKEVSEMVYALLFQARKDGIIDND